MESVDLSRFLEAQVGMHQCASAEISAGRKRTHWMWFIFPQLHGLGQSNLARKYSLKDETEARAYLGHPVLGPRLRQMVALVGASAQTPEQIFNSDACKYLSCLTLFALVDEEGYFQRELSKQWNLKRCSFTVDSIRRARGMA